MAWVFWGRGRGFSGCSVPESDPLALATGTAPGHIILLFLILVFLRFPQAKMHSCRSLGTLCSLPPASCPNATGCINNEKVDNGCDCVRESNKVKK